VVSIKLEIFNRKQKECKKRFVQKCQDLKKEQPKTEAMRRTE